LKSSLASCGSSFSLPMSLSELESKVNVSVIIGVVLDKIIEVHLSKFGSFGY
jgi:hypothetical protein